MISCQKCEFKVPPKMRFALVKNFCPSCGASLLSDDDASEIAGISKRLQGQEFIINLAATLSKEVVQNLVYDMSIYIKFELNKELVSVAIKEQDPLAAYETEKIGEPDDVSASRPKRPTRPMARAGSNGESREIRSQVYSPLRSGEQEDDWSELPDRDESDDGDDFDPVEMGSESEEDSRVAKLKAIYAKSNHAKPFGGISRSGG